LWRWSLSHAGKHPEPMTTAQHTHIHTFTFMEDLFACLCELTHTQTCTQAFPWPGMSPFWK